VDGQVWHYSVKKTVCEMMQDLTTPAWNKRGLAMPAWKIVKFGRTQL
jgi:hypothetical protein